MELIWIAIIGFVGLMGLAMFIYSLPAERFKRKRVTPPPPMKEKNWEDISKRWEKNNALLVNEVEALKRERKALLEQIEDGKKTVQEHLEQLAREKAWREKEGQMVEKVKNVDHELKEELRKAQNILNEGHSVKLRLEIEIQENKITIARLKEEVRSLTAKQLAWEKESEANKKELRELKFTNAELKKQKDDIQWVTKTDYDLVMRRCRQLEGEMSRLTREREQAAQQPAEQPAAQPSGQVSQQAPQQHIPEQPLEQLPEQVPEKVPEPSSEQISEQSPEKTAEQPSEPLPERVLENPPEQASQQVPEQNPEKVPEPALEQMSEQSPEKATEKPSEQVTEQTSEKTPEQPSGQGSEQAPEQIPEPPPQQVPEENPEKDPQKKHEN